MIDSLIALIPSVRPEKLKPTLESLFSQIYFDQIEAIISGPSCRDENNCQKLKKYYPNIHFAKVPPSGHIFPPKARNLALDALNSLKLDHKKYRYWILFLDDDVILNPNYVYKVSKFIQCNPPVIAAMGKMQSSPYTFIGKLIDYSNFWWLQIDHDIKNLGWLATAAAVIEYKYLNGFKFNEKYVYVGEDVDYFCRLATKHHGHLGICSKAHCAHHHNRTTLISFLKYQFNNGYYNFDWYYHNRNYLKSFIKQTNSSFSMAYQKNLPFYKKHQLFTFLVYSSFMVQQFGVFYGSIKKDFLEFLHSLFYTTNNL